MNEETYVSLRRMNAIFDDPQRSELAKVTAAFDATTAGFIAASERAAELARALGDEETAVKERIKAGVMQQAREMFAFHYARATGKREGLWDE